MSNPLVFMPGVCRVTVCYPACASSPEHVLAVELSDHLIADLGVGPGDFVVISRLERPAHGEPGAVRHAGQVYVGYLYFPDGGGVILGSLGMGRVAAHFRDGECEILGRVDRVCESCELRRCRSVPHCSAPDRRSA